MLTVDIIPVVAPLYMVLTPVRVLTYYILNNIIYLRVYIGYAAVPPHIYVHIPIRVGVHIAWRAQETGVG